MSLAPRGQDDKRPAEGRGRPPSPSEPAAEAGADADDRGGGEGIHRSGDRVSVADELQAAGLAAQMARKCRRQSTKATLARDFYRPLVATLAGVAQEEDPNPRKTMALSALR